MAQIPRTIIPEGGIAAFIDREIALGHFREPTPDEAIQAYARKFLRQDIAIYMSRGGEVGMLLDYYRDWRAANPDAPFRGFGDGELQDLERRIIAGCVK